jgi:hypothetical protein
VLENQQITALLRRSKHISGSKIDIEEGLVIAVPPLGSSAVLSRSRADKIFDEDYV